MITMTLRIAIPVALAVALLVGLPLVAPSSRDRVEAAITGIVGGNSDGEPVESKLTGQVREPPRAAAATRTVPRETSATELMPHQWMESATPLPDGYLKMAHGELTPEDGGRDAFSFTAQAGMKYIVEVECRMDIQDDGDVHYVDDYLVDPSILEVVNQDGVRAMGEQDGGGLLPNWARGYFVPEVTGTYYLAVGSGQLDPSGTGHYTISVRQDDHADDWQTDPEITIRPGESITAIIHSDVSPDHPGIHPYDWAHWGSTSEPLWAVESLDDRDVFRFEIDREGTYRLEVAEASPDRGIWAVWAESESRQHFSWNGPLESLEDNYPPGVYYVGVGTTYESEGNTGPYVLSLVTVIEDESNAAGP